MACSHHKNSMKLLGWWLFTKRSTLSLYGSTIHDWTRAMNLALTLSVSGLFSVVLAWILEAIHLQCFHPYTMWVGTVTWTYICDDLHPIFPVVNASAPNHIQALQIQKVHPVPQLVIFCSLFGVLEVKDGLDGAGMKKKSETLECGTRCTSWICNNL